VASHGVTLTTYTSMLIVYMVTGEVVYKCVLFLWQCD